MSYCAFPCDYIQPRSSFDHLDMAGLSQSLVVPSDALNLSQFSTFQGIEYRFFSMPNTMASLFLCEYSFIRV
jgi:hypothetical protein